MEFLKIMVTVLALSLLLSACNEDEKIKDKKVSTIQIKPPFIPGTQPLTIYTPKNGAGLSAIGAQENNITFDGSGTEYGTLLLFDQEPVFKDGVINNFFNICLGGATSFVAGHGWNGFRVNLGTDATTSGLFACKNDPFEMLDNSKKVAPDHSTFPLGGTIYMVLIGYNSFYQATHSSSVQKFVVLP